MRVPFSPRGRRGPLVTPLLVELDDCCANLHGVMISRAKTDAITSARQCDVIVCAELYYDGRWAINPIEWFTCQV